MKQSASRRAHPARWLGLPAMLIAASLAQPSPAQMMVTFDYAGGGVADSVGGGGGSGFGPTDAVFETGVHEGHGRVTVTWVVGPPATMAGISPSSGPAAAGQASADIPAVASERRLPRRDYE